MSRLEILNKVIEICKDVFNDDELLITENTCAADIDAWDSLAHLSITSDIEDEFNISLIMDEIMNSKNIGELVDAIERRL